MSSLSSALSWQRRHVLDALAGLTDHDLRTAHVPSGWSPLNLVRHLTIDVEMFWFRAVMAGDRDAVPAFEDGLSGWPAPLPDRAEDVLDDYRTESARSDELIARLAPGAEPRWWPTAAGPPPADLTAVLVHVLVDTAAHAGQLDVVRERIDGTQFLIVP